MTPQDKMYYNKPPDLTDFPGYTGFRVYRPEPRPVVDPQVHCTNRSHIVSPRLVFCY